MSKSTSQHRAEAEAKGGVTCAVITVSDTRTLETDRGGAMIDEKLRKAGHMVASRQIVPDERAEIDAALRALHDHPEIQAVILTGGTGIAARDVTPEVVESHLDRKLDGFGELFRMLSWEEIGPAAMLSRALGGVMGRSVVLAIPGSTAAVRLAMDSLIIPELRHLVHEANK